MLFCRQHGEPGSFRAHGRNRFHTGIGAYTCPKVNCFSWKVSAKLPHIRIIAIENGSAEARQRCDQFILGTGNAGLTVGKIFGVGSAHICHHAPVGRGDFAKGGNLSGVRHSHFQNGNFMLRLEPQ